MSLTLVTKKEYEGRLWASHYTRSVFHICHAYKLHILCTYHIISMHYTYLYNIYKLHFLYIYHANTLQLWFFWNMMK